MVRLRPLLALCVLVVSLAGLAPAAQAQAGEATPPASSDEVQSLLVEAVREYDASNYEEAYALFLRAHALRPTARTERALGKTAFGLRRYGEAVRWLSAALEDTRQPLTDEMRSEVEGFLLRARSFLGHFVIRASPSEASVEVDGAPLEGEAADLELGEHEILVRAAGHETVTRRLSVRGGEDEAIEIALIAVTASTVVIASPSDPGGTQRDLGWASLAAGGVMLGVGAVATILWADSVASLNANIDRGACAIDAEENVSSGAAVCYDQQTRYRIALPLQYVGYVTGGILLGVAAALVASAPSADDAGSALSCAPGLLGVSCRGSF